jgi:hypothetical protein
VKKQDAFSEFFSCRLRPDEARRVREAIRTSGKAKPDWMRAALLKVAESE